MTCHLPPKVQEAADKAERRKEAAMDRLIERTGGEGHADPFLKAMEGLIDADKRVVEMLQKRAP